LLSTTKPGITRLVTITAMVGFVLGAWQGGAQSLTHLLRLGAIIAVGTWVSASGANALNQWWESTLDARMRRTRGRPIPAALVQSVTVLKIGLLLALGGTGVLLLAGPVPAMIGLTCSITYVLVYTPLKTRSAWCTLIGAVPGALPPVIGWAAATGGWELGHVLDPGAQALFWLMMVWQIPHFMAIAWMYRTDYADGGMRMLPVIDPAGRGTAFVVLLTAALLIPATLAPAVTMPDLVGLAYPVVALVSGVWFFWMCVRLARTRTDAMARRVFFASIAHLPLLLLVMVGEAFVRSVLL
jgi:protoheme IX farnesyltransferase